MKSLGAPLIEEDLIRIPENLDDRNFLELHREKKDTNIIISSISEVIPIFHSVGILN